MTKFDQETFEQKKRSSLLQVLFKAARLANEAALRRIRERTGEYWIRPVHTTLFPHIPFDGIRLTALAEKMGVTKQAVQRLVDELESGGFLERVPDPDDGRAKLIRWSARGGEGLDEGVDFLLAFERELADVLGKESLVDAHATLSRLVDYLEE